MSPVARARDAVHPVCQEDLHQGCPGRYEVWIRGGDSAALVGRCGCACHDGTPVAIVWRQGASR